MRINSISQIAFQKLPIKKHAGFNITDDFVYRAQDENRTMYTVKTEKFMNDKLDIKFQNDDEMEPAASQQYKIYPNMIFVDSMYTNPELQHKYGFGKSMHLLNIVEMFENNAESIELDATSTAIPFHSSMGFYPDDEWANGLQTNIRIISNNYIPELQNYAKEAKKLIEDEKVAIDMEDINRRGNKILYEYTKEALKVKPKDELKTLFSHVIKMKLTKEKILANKEFYNKLFDKYEIDYHID